MKALGEKTTKTIGNFWNYLVLKLYTYLAAAFTGGGLYTDNARHSDGIRRKDGDNDARGGYTACVAGACCRYHSY